MVYKNASPVDFGILLGLAYQTLTDELRAELVARGFTDLGPAYGYVFRALDGAPLHLGELASRLAITSPGMLKIIDEMIERGYVERAPDPADGRAKLLSLAARGRQALAAARQFHTRFEQRLGKACGVRNVALTREVLALLVGTAGVDAAHARLRAF